jgi:hypothetical protein
MKHLLYIIIAASIALVACDFETSDNGDLDGYWQLSEMDTLATGRTADMRYSKIVCAVQVRLLEFRRADDINTGVMFRFEQRGDSLLLTNPVQNNRNISDSLVNNPATLVHYGMTATTGKDGKLEVKFLIEKLNDSRMTLSNKLYRLHFRKY